MVVVVVVGVDVYAVVTVVAVLTCDSIAEGHDPFTVGPAAAESNAASFDPLPL